MQQRAAGGRHDRHLENTTSYQKSDFVNECIFIEEQSSQISSRSDLNGQNLGLY